VSLLRVEFRPDLETPEGERDPYMVSMPLHRSETPCLVSSISGQQWVKNVQKGSLFAGIQDSKFDDSAEWNRRLLKRIFIFSKKERMDNIKKLHPSILRTTLNSIKDMHDIGFEIVCHPEFDWPKFLAQNNVKPENAVFDKFREWAEEIKEEDDPELCFLDVFDTPVVASEMVKRDELIILPSDRQHIGLIGNISNKRHFFAVKNIKQFITFFKK
jgi:hypothetical protein